MRYIAVFLVLANIGYFGWNQYQSEPVTVEQAVEDRSLLNTGLMLVSEFERQSQELARITQESARLCSEVSNFTNFDDAKLFISRAQQSGFGAQLNFTGEPLDPQYRVFLPPSSSRTVATETLDSLSEGIGQAGLEIETYIITRGLLENAIALGIFADEESASNTRSQVSELGYTVEIEEIPQSTGDMQVLLTPLDSGRIENSEWLGLAVDRPYLTRIDILCETIAQGTQFP